MGDQLYWYTHSESDCAWVSKLPPEEVEPGDDGCVLYAGPAILCTREEIVALVPAAADFTIRTETSKAEDTIIEMRRKQTMEQYSDPVMWTRANGNEIHINDMSQHHLRNALAHLEKAMEGQEEMPVIYYNMLARAKAVGIGITDAQIDRLITRAIKPAPVKFAAYDRDIDYEKFDGVLLKLEEDGDEVTLAVCDDEGDQKYKLFSFLKDGRVHVYAEIPNDSPIVHRGPQMDFVVH